MAGTAEKTMGRPKGKRTERNDVAVKIDRGVAQMAKAIATREGTTVAEVLTDAARSVIEKRYAAMLRKLEGGAK
jgi:hypothetical protein